MSCSVAPLSAALLALVALTSCSKEATRREEAVTAPSAWHFAFAEVRAFRLNWEEESAMVGIDDGPQLNPTRIPRDGIVLTGEQVERLQAAVLGDHPGHDEAACMYPHHAFVFYDNAASIVGSIDVCLLCSTYQASPEGFADSWDLAELAGLLRDDLGLPLTNPDW